MKRLCVIAVVIGIPICGATIDQRPEREFGYIAPRVGSPRAIRMSALRVRVDDFFSRFAPLYHLGAHDRMQPFAMGRGAGGFSYTKFRQYHRDLRVIGAEVVLTHRDGLVVFALGGVAPDLVVDGRPTLSPQEASERAAAAIRRTARLPGADPLPLRSPPVVELAIGARRALGRPTYRLIYRCTMNTASHGAYTVDIDAHTGTVVNLIPRARGAWTPVDVSGQSLFDGVVQFSAEADDATSTCRLHAPFVKTLDAQAPPGENTPFTGVAVDFLSSGCAFDEGAVKTGVSVHWAIERARFYFLQQFDRQGWNNKGDGSVAYVNVPFNECEDVSGACWDPDVEAVMVVTPPVNMLPYAALDLIAHEYTHGVAQSAVLPGGFETPGESAALEESFADLFATAVEFATPGTTPNWTIGEDVVSNGYVPRNLKDPKQKQHPNAYEGQYWEDPNQLTNIHRDGGVQNFWFYLLANNTGQDTSGTIDDCVPNTPGCEPYSVEGLGMDAAARIAYENLTTKLTSNATYWDAREATTETTIQLCGEGSQMQVSAEDAWHAVNVGGIATPLTFSPDDNAPSVEPWPATLKWRAGLGDTSWDIQISTTPDFSADVQAGSTSTSAMENGVLFAVYQAILEPHQKYYWRVRRTPTPQTPAPGALPPKMLDLCWRPSVSFTTAQKYSTPISPRGPNHYPWQLVFKWGDTPGAVGYDFELFETSDCDHAKPIFSYAANGLGNFGRFNAKVQQEHWWRIRPKGRINPVVPGVWSPCVEFGTTMPTVKLVKPAHATYVYPWGVELEWKSLDGAAKYKVYLTHGREGFTADAPVETFELGAFHHTMDINLVPEMTYKYVKQWWKVGVEGPEPFHQEGKPAEDFFVNDGSATTPATSDYTECLACDACIECPIKYFPYGSDITIGWTHVPLAEKYKLTFFPFKAPANGGDFWVDFNNPLLMTTVDRLDAPNSDQQSKAFQGSVVASPAIGTQTYGYWYSVQAIGPEGLESPVAHQTTPENPLSGGLMKGDSLYYVISPPVLASTAHMLQDGGTGQFYAEGDPASPFVTVSVAQSPQWSPTGQWEYRIYDDPGCVDFAFNLVSGATAAVGWGPGDEGAFRVRTRGEYGGFQLQGPGWSPCTDVHMVSADKQKKKDCGDGSVGAWEQCDDGNTVSGDGCNSSCQTEGPAPSACDLLVQAGSVEGSPPGGFQVDLGTQVGNFWFVWDTVDIPDRLQLFRGATKLADTGCVGTQDPACQGSGCGGSQFIPWDGTGSTTVRVVVDANCQLKNGITQWAFVVTCPAGPPKPQASPNPEKK